MFFSSFESKEDHDSIIAAMEIFPTVGIFMCEIPVIKKKKQGKKKRPKARTIFEYTSFRCLCALNYFRDTGQHTQVLWLATTLEEPPVASIHTIWRKFGSLPTYCAFSSNSTQESVQVPWIIASCPYRLLPKKPIPLATSTFHLASFLMMQVITDCR
jgi:hypothetical protein